MSPPSLPFAYVGMSSGGSFILSLLTKTTTRMHKWLNILLLDNLFSMTTTEFYSLLLNIFLYVVLNANLSYHALATIELYLLT